MNLQRSTLSLTAALLVLACAGVARAQDQPRFTVSGVIIKDDGGSMAWLGEPTHTRNKLVRVREGDQIGPYRVTSIQEDRVELAGPAGPVVVRLTASAPDMPAQTTTASTTGPPTGVSGRSGSASSPQTAGGNTGSRARRRPVVPGIQETQERRPLTPEEAAQATKEVKAYVDRIKAAGPKSSGFGMFMGTKPQ